MLPPEVDDEFVGAAVVTAGSVVAAPSGAAATGAKLTAATVFSAAASWPVTMQQRVPYVFSIAVSLLNY